MTELTIQKFKDRDYGFLMMTATVVSDEVDPKVFVVQDMVDPMDLPNEVPFLVDVASRVDMSAYSDTPAANGMYRAANFTMVEHDEYTLDLVIDKIQQEVSDNINLIQRAPLNALEVKIISSDD